MWPSLPFPSKWAHCLNWSCRCPLLTQRWVTNLSAIISPSHRMSVPCRFLHLPLLFVCNQGQPALLVRIDGDGAHIRYPHSWSAFNLIFLSLLPFCSWKMDVARKDWCRSRWVLVPGFVTDPSTMNPSVSGQHGRDGGTAKQHAHIHNDSSHCGEIPYDFGCII